MKNKLIYGIIAAFAISLIALAGISFAYKGTSSVKGPNYNAEVHEQLEQAIESGDYDAWLKIRQDNNLPTKGKIFSVINKDNFDQYTELHYANLAGDTQRAEEIRTSLGLGTGLGKQGKQGAGKGKMHANGNGSCTTLSFVDTNQDGVCDHFGERRN